MSNLIGIQMQDLHEVLYTSDILSIVLKKK